MAKNYNNNNSDIDFVSIILARLYFFKQSCPGNFDPGAFLENSSKVPGNIPLRKR